MSSIRISTLLICLSCGPFALLTSACGGDDDDGGNDAPTEFTPSVASSAELGSLSDSDWQSLCMDMSAYLASPAVQRSVLEGGCRLAGVFGAAFLPGTETDADARATCKELRSSCQQEGVATQPDMCTPPSGTCTATVAELKSCVETYPQTFTQLGNSVPTCEELTLADLDLQGSFGEVMDSPACQTVATKCPEFSMPSTDQF